MTPQAWSRRAVLCAVPAAALAGRARASVDYRDAVETAYGGPLDLAQAHHDAWAEARRLTARADVLLQGQGLAAGPVDARLRRLAADGRWLYPDSEAGRAQAVADMNLRLAGLPAVLGRWLDSPVPAAEVRRPAAKDEARGGYREPPVYFVDLRNIRNRPAWTLPTVAFHETIPGHAVQAAVTGGRRRPPGFSEAWAIYAEQLAVDIGLFADDPRGELGYLHWRLFRMGRVLADIGQGVLGWSADQAVATMRGLQGFDAAFVTIEADAARMRAQPGIYAAQGAGALAIARARPRRRERWRAFHRTILADAPWPYVKVGDRGGPER